MGGAAASERIAGGRGRGGMCGRGRATGGFWDVHTAVRGGWVHQMAGVFPPPIFVFRTLFIFQNPTILRLPTHCDCMLYGMLSPPPPILLLLVLLLFFFLLLLLTLLLLLLLHAETNDLAVADALS